MRRLSHILLVAVLLLGVGCDSDNEPSLAEQFIGTWTLNAVSDDVGDRTDLIFSAANGLTLTFNDDQSYSLFFDAIDDTGDISLAGTFNVSEARSVVALSVPFIPDAPPSNVDFGYTFVTDSQVDLTVDALIVNTLLMTTGTPAALQGLVTLSVTK
ncbi:MAG: hypothetical protein AAF730_06115 [Bacteroidota bacterium]